jgi:hypothetical protein
MTGMTMSCPDLVQRAMANMQREGILATWKKVYTTSVTIKNSDTVVRVLSKNHWWKSPSPVTELHAVMRQQIIPSW